MNKKVFIFFVLISLTFAAFAQEKMYVCCNYNVRVRKADDINSEAIGKIPPLAGVIVLAATDTTHKINGLDAKWVKVRYGNLEGFVLDCFLQRSFSKAEEILSMEGVYQGYKVINSKNLNGSEVQEVQNCKVTLEYLGYNQFAFTYNSEVLDRGFNTSYDKFPMILENINTEDVFCNRSASKGIGGIESFFRFSGKDMVKHYVEAWGEDSDVAFDLYLKKVALP